MPDVSVPSGDCVASQGLVRDVALRVRAQLSRGPLCLSVDGVFWARGVGPLHGAWAKPLDRSSYLFETSCTSPKKSLLGQVVARTSSIPFGWSWVGGVFDVGSSCQWRNASFCLLKNVNFKVSSMARRFSMHPGSRIRKYPRRFIYQPSEMVKHLPWFHGCPLKVLLVDRTSTGPFDMPLLGRGSTNRRGVLSSFLGYPNLWRWPELVITFCAVPSYIYIYIRIYIYTYIQYLVGGLEPWNFMTFHSVGKFHPPPTDSYFSAG